jgi:3-hydroxyacyl-[acyl-carrier-protein] dehydratase
MNELKKQGTFFFDPEDPIYGDHFPGNPIVPGSLIVYAFMTVCRQDQPFTLYAVEEFRFRQFIPPGEYAYEILGVEAGPNKRQIACRLFHDDKPVVTGKLQYET